MKIVFFGSGAFGLDIFRSLLEEDYSIRLVTLPPRVKGRGRHLEYNEIYELARGNAEEVYLEEDIRTESFYQILNSYAPDLAVVVDYGKLIPASLIGLPRLGTVNIHPSLLPRYRGPTPIQTALINGDQKTGVSLQYINERIDAGDIISRTICPVAPGDNYGSLQSKLDLIACKQLKEFLKDPEKGQAVPQNENEADYCRKFSKEDLKTDWSMDAVELHNRIRAFSPHPGMTAEYKGRRIKIFESEIAESGNGDPGVILESNKNVLSVACGKGAVNLLQVQPENRKIMPVTDFINGHHPLPGEMFGRP